VVKWCAARDVSSRLQWAVDQVGPRPFLARTRFQDGRHL